MVIDDSNTIRRTAEALLKKAGYEVLTAADGFEAMSLITDNHPDIIFVDIMMPRLDGYQTCQLIKNNKKFRDTPVIMLSSKDGLFDRARRSPGCRGGAARNAAGSGVFSRRVMDTAEFIPRYPAPC